MSKSRNTVLLALMVSGILIISFAFNWFPINTGDEMTIRHFAWHYPDYDNTDGTKQSQVTNAADLGFTDLIISINARSLDHTTSAYDLNYSKNVEDLIDTISKASMNTTLMILQDPAFYNDSKAAIAHLHGVERLISRIGKQVTGLHFDIEPHADAIWDNETRRPEIFQSFMDTLMILGDYIRTSNLLSDLEVSIAVPWWFNEKDLDERYPKELGNYFDFLIFMVYGGIGDELTDYHRVEDELTHIKGVLGIGYSEFGSTSETLDFREDLTKAYANNTAVIGTSIFKLSQLNSSN